MGSKRSTPDEVALLLHQISLPAARRDYQLRSSSPAPRADHMKLDPSTSSSQLVSRAFQNARALSFNAAAHKDTNVAPFVLHHAPNQRVFFSGPLIPSHATAMGTHSVVRAPAAPRPERSVDTDVSGHHLSGRELHQPAHELGENIHPAQSNSTSIGLQLFGSRSTSTAHPWKNSAMGDTTDRAPARRAFSGDLTRASMKQHRPGELTRESKLEPEKKMKLHRSPACSGELTREESKLEHEKKRGESKRRPTASIAWDTLNESQANSPQHELAAIPFQWEEAPGKPLATSTMARVVVRENNSNNSQLATPAAQESSLREDMERAQSHRFYARAAPLMERPRNSSFDAAATHLISELVAPEAHIDLVAPAAAKFLVESWVSPTVVAPEANVAVPFQWEEAPGVPKLDEMEAGMQLKAPAVQLQLPPRLVSPPPPPPDAAMAKEALRGRLRTRSMSGPLAGYYPHASPARRRQLQRDSVTHRRSCSPSKARSGLISFAAAVRIPPHSAVTASLEAELRDTAAPTRSVLLLSRDVQGDTSASEFRRPPLRCISGYNVSPLKRSVSPSRRIHALAKQLTCRIRPAKQESLTSPWSPTSLLQEELHLSGPSSSNSDMDASYQTPVSELAFSKSFSRVSYESFEHSFAHQGDAELAHEQLGPSSPIPPGSSSPPKRAASPVKAMVKLGRSGSAIRKSSSGKSGGEMWAPTLASYFRCLEAATMVSSNVVPARPGAPAAAMVNSGNEVVQTRLPYTMPSSTSTYVTPEQNFLWKEYCESPNHAEFGTSSCLGVKLPVAKFVSRGRRYESHSMAWSALPNASSVVEDGYRSPAYAATLELLSPSAELFRKKKRVVLGVSSRRVKLVMPSTRRKTQIMEAVCTSLKRALYKCAKRCCRKASSPPPLNAASAR